MIVSKRKIPDSNSTDLALPKLMVGKGDEFDVVLLVHKINGDAMSAMVVESRDKHNKIGDYSSAWRRELFVDYYGSIEIKQWAWS